MFEPVTGDRRLVLAAVALLAVGLLGGSTGDGHALAGLGLLVFGAEGERTLRGLVAAIAVGAAVVGALAWIAAGVVSGPLSTGVATGLGIAVGGGIGSLVWLLAVGEEEEPATPEEMTVDMRDDEEEVPAPEPADLFEASPDPILYYGGPEPLVRAVNPAFAAVFGVEPDAVEGRPLADALQVETGSTALVDAATAGRPTDERRECATADGPSELRVRVVPTGSGDRPAGYVVYGPVD